MNEPDLNSILAEIEAKPALEQIRANLGGQDRFARTLAHEIILAGANKSGKSTMGVVRCGYHTIAERDKYGRMTGKTIHPYLDLRIPARGVDGWISTWSSETQVDVLHPLIEKYLEPYYSKPPLKNEDGAIKEMYFPPNSIIRTKWQKQRLGSYAGPNKSFVYMDEPHKKSIYNECKARTFESQGYTWICMTPVIDPDSPLGNEDVMWMRKDIIEPWMRDKSKFPLTDVIYIDLEENSQFINIEHIDGMMATFSSVEKLIRRTGRFVVFTGRHCFNQQMVTEINNYLMDHPEESIPEYGALEYDDTESGNLYKIVFDRHDRDFFPYEPSGEYTMKFWEHPVMDDDLQENPGYTMACDVAEGSPGGDYSSVHVARNDNSRIVAALHGHLSEEVLAKELWLLGHYYNDGGQGCRPAMLAIEVKRGSYGSSAQKLLISGSRDFDVPRYPMDRMYFRPTTKDIASGKKYAYAPGWDTNSATRKYVITGMREGILRAYKSIQDDKHCSIPDLGILKEAEGFVQNKAGKYTGNPDDRLFSLGILNIILDKTVDDMLLSEEEEPTYTDQDTWFIEPNESGILVPHFNFEGVINREMNTDTKLRF